MNSVEKIAFGLIHVPAIFNKSISGRQLISKYGFVVWIPSSTNTYSLNFLYENRFSIFENLKKTNVSFKNNY